MIEPRLDRFDCPRANLKRSERQSNRTAEKIEAVHVRLVRGILSARLG
jgi:hypothetical protein